MRNFNPQEICYFYSNKKAWLTSSIFEKFITEFERELTENSIILVVYMVKFKKTPQITYIFFFFFLMKT